MEGSGVVRHVRDITLTELNGHVCARGAFAVAMRTTERLMSSWVIR
jgi:hypothetical protein